MSAGFGDSESLSVCVSSDTLPHFGCTDAFFPLLGSTGISFLVLQHINMTDEFTRR